MAPKRSASTSPKPSTSSRRTSSRRKGQLGASIQFDLVPNAYKKASVPGRGRLITQPVTQYYDTGTGLSDGRAVDRHHMPDAVELLLHRSHAEAHPVRLDSSGAGPSHLRHCYMCETRDSVQWYYWPPKRGPNPGQPPHHRVCHACRASLANGRLDKEEHRASRCGLDYDCPDGACGPNGCRGAPNLAPCFASSTQFRLLTHMARFRCVAHSIRAGSSAGPRTACRSRTREWRMTALQDTVM
jgi:hypothetical protein